MMIDFKELAEECKKFDNANEGIIKYISVFFSQKDYFIIVRQVEKDNFDNLQPFVGVIEGKPNLFVFTSLDFAKETIAKEIKDDAEKLVLKYPMSSFYDYLKYIRDNEISGVSINYGDYGLVLNIEFLIQIYELLVLNKKGEVVQYEKGTKMMLGVPSNMDEIKELITTNKHKIPDIDSLNVCLAFIDKGEEKPDRTFILIPSFTKELSEVEIKGVLFEIHTIISDILKREEFADCSISFYPNTSIIPENLLEVTKVF